MKHIKTTLIYVFVIILSLGIVSCSKDDININTTIGDGQNSGGGSGGGTNNDTTGTKAQKVYFSANVMALISRSGSTAPIEKGYSVSAYAYNGNNRVNKVDYVSAAGELDPKTSGNVMSVVTGTYNFYAIGNYSVNNGSLPTFQSTTASVTNGTDWIWASAKDKAVEGNENYTLNFTHSCIQVVVKLTVGEGITVNSLPQIQLSPSVIGSNNTWDLYTGIINPATSVSTSSLTAMAVALESSGTSSTPTIYSAQYTMIPLSMSGDLSTKFNITINGESTARNYEVSLPINGGSLAAGNCYIYNVELKGNTITFTNVTVTNWVDVTYSGTLVPGQI